MEVQSFITLSKDITYETENEAENFIKNQKVIEQQMVKGLIK